MAESTAKQRAAARRQAILSRGTDRLGKLTHAARGEEGASLFDEKPAPGMSSRPTSNFIGEETFSMPTPPAFNRTSPSPLRTRDPSPMLEDPSQWNAEQQQRLMQALMGGGPPPMDANGADPLQAMMAALLNQQQSSQQSADESSSDLPPALPPMFPGLSSMPNAGPFPATALPPPRTLYHKLSPLLHILSIAFLVAFFVLQIEPSVHASLPTAIPQSSWERWASLRWAHGGQWGVQPVPFFYAFTTLQVILHSIRIFSEPAPPPPSGMLGMALMHLPPPFPGYISGALRYAKMGSAVVDDISVLLFVIGFIIWISGWAAP